MPSQARKHVTQNEALLIADTLIQLFVGSRQIAAPPTGAADCDSNTSGPKGRWGAQPIRAPLSPSSVERLGVSVSEYT